jgi:lysophospholipase L1-like esterase
MKFKKNDTICFLGDSITADGKWIREICEILIQNYSDERIKIINCGVPGDAADRALFRLYLDCLKHFPNYVVIMFGMNDIRRELYLLGDNQAERQQYIDIHKNSTEALIIKCQANGAEVILCTPTPYDEVQVNDIPNLSCNIGVGKCSENIKMLSEKYHCTVVDFNGIMQKEIATKVIINPDRVHPNALGHHIMAQIFLNTLELIETVDFENVVEISRKNAERYETEQILRAIKFIEWCSLYEYNKVNHSTIEEKKKVISKRIGEEGNEWIDNAYKLYIENVDFNEEYMGKLIEQTVAVYN